MTDTNTQPGEVRGSAGSSETRDGSSESRTGEGLAGSEAVVGLLEDLVNHQARLDRRLSGLEDELGRVREVVEDNQQLSVEAHQHAEHAEDAAGDAAKRVEQIQVALKGRTEVLDDDVAALQNQVHQLNRNLKRLAELR